MAKQTQMKRGLGRGLDTLIGDLTLDETEALSNPKDGSGAHAASMPIEFLKPDPSQARKNFPEASLKELANSIAGQGNYSTDHCKARPRIGEALLDCGRRAKVGEPPSSHNFDKSR